MLEDFRGITIKGRCFENETTLEFFPKNIAKTKDNRVALVFGRNGSGKTTVTRAFSFIANQQHDFIHKISISLLCKAENLNSLHKSIYVFDERYIQSKLGFSTDRTGLDTVVHFGNHDKYKQKMGRLLEQESALMRQSFRLDTNTNPKAFLADILSRTGFMKRRSRIDPYENNIGTSIFSIIGRMADIEIPNDNTSRIQLIQEFNHAAEELKLRIEKGEKPNHHSPKTGLNIKGDSDEIIALKKKLHTINLKLTRFEIKHLTNINGLRIYEKPPVYKLAQIEEEKQKIISASASINLAIEQINNALSYMFMSWTRLQIVPGYNNLCYHVKVNGRSVLPTDISIGERNALALAYFFSQIMNGKELEEIPSVERLIILDDPISSFDHENKMGVLSYIMHEIENLKSSRFICLMHDLHSFMALASSIKAHDGKSGATNPIGQFTYTLNCKRGGLKPLNLETTNEYRFNFDEVLEYASLEEPEENVHVGNQMRRILEAYSTFVYRKGFEYLFYGELIRGENAKLYNEYFKNNLSRFVVNDESHLQGRIRSLTDCNSLFASIDDHEKQRAIRDSICLLYLINPEHILSLRDKNEEKDALKALIEPWLAAIRENSPTLRIEDEIETRSIP